MLQGETVENKGGVELSGLSSFSTVTTNHNMLKTWLNQKNLQCGNGQTMEKGHFPQCKWLKSQGVESVETPVYKIHYGVFHSSIVSTVKRR